MTFISLHILSSDVLIIGSVISIGHYQQFVLVFLKYVTDIVLIMSCLVIISSLITLMIFIIIEKMLKPQGKYNIGFVLVRFIKIPINSLIGASPDK